MEGGGGRVFCLFLFVLCFGLNKIYSFIQVISSTNKYRKHKSSMLISVLPIDEIIITQTFTMATWQIVVKKSEATKQTRNENNNKTTTTTKLGAGGGG